MEKQPVKGTLEPIPGRCGAPTSRFNATAADPVRYCQSWPSKKAVDPTKCFRHGRKKKAIAPPKANPILQLSPRLLANYDKALKDPQLHSLKSEISWARAYLEETQLRGAEGATIGKKAIEAAVAVVKAWDAFRRATGPKVPAHVRQAASAAMVDTVATLRATIAPAESDRETRAEVRAHLSTIANLTDKDNKQLERLYNMVTAERAMSLRIAEHTAFEEAMDQFVHDNETKLQIRRYLASRFEQLARGTTAPALPPVRGPVVMDVGPGQIAKNVSESAVSVPSGDASE